MKNGKTSINSMKATATGLLAAAGHLGWQVLSLKIDDPDNCLARFRANRTTGWIIFAGLVATSVAGALRGA